MKNILSKGIICYRNKSGIEFRVCTIEYYLYEDESFKYIFKPDFEVIDMLTNDGGFQGIPGFNLDLRKTEYERDNIIPVFISERCPSSNREDLYQLLEKVGMDYLNPVEYLIRTDEAYSGDPLYVIAYEEKEKIILEDVIGKNNITGVIKFIIEKIAKGDEVYLKNGTLLNNIESFEILKFLYEKSLATKNENTKEAILKAKKQGKFKGRKPIEVDTMLFREQIEKINKKQITARKAAQNLGISIDKFYRVKKVLQKENDTLLQ